MCQRRNAVAVFQNGKAIKVDACLENLLVVVSRLHYYRGRIVASCCGHGRYPRTILFRLRGEVRDLRTRRTIPRKRRFYQKDEEGFYFVPEILDGRSWRGAREA